MQDSSKPISILHLTDPHILATSEATLLGIDTAYYFDVVLEQAINSGRHFDLCLLTGDLAQDPCVESYQYLLNQLQKLNIPCICLPGNHDNYAIMQSVLNTEKINCRKKVMLGNWQVISLNSQIPGSPKGNLAKAELSFLEYCLQKNPTLFSLIAVHHHCIPTGSQWIDTMMIQNAEEFLALIGRYPNAKVIINGHIHQAMDIQTTTCRVLTTPSTCFQFKPDSKKFGLDDTSPGYRYIQLNSNGSIATEIARTVESLMGLSTDTQGY